VRLGILGLVFAALIILILTGWALSRQDSQDNSDLSETQLGIHVDFTLTPTSTPRQLSTPVPTFAATATFIPVPTLEFDDGTEAIEHLFATNHGCEFPCWWGIMPGETRWAAAEAFLSPLAVEFRLPEDPGYLEDGSVAHQVVLPVPEDLDPDGRGTLTIVEDWWGDVRSISFAANFAELGYGLEGMIQQFGSPNEIFISARGSDPANLEAFGIYSLGLYYGDEGIMMVYFGIIEDGTSQDEILDICKSGLLDPSSWLMLWDPANTIPFEMLAPIGLFTSGELDYQPIGEVSEYSISSFSEQFINTDDKDFCIEVANPGVFSD
jgi:hypothetical protein